MNSRVPQSAAIMMPAYNEAACIEAVVRQALAVLDQLKRYGAGATYLVVMNDGSSDDTGAILDRLAAADYRIRVWHGRNGGHGASIRAGYQRALDLGVGWVFQIDSDGQFDLGELLLLWLRRRESPVVLGERRKRHDPLHRLILTRLVRCLIALFFGCYVRDANVPFRLYRADYLRYLLASIPPRAFAPNIFMTILARRHLGQLTTIPVRHWERATGEVTLVSKSLLKACWRSVGELWRWRLALPRTLKKLPRPVLKPRLAVVSR